MAGTDIHAHLIPPLDAADLAPVGLAAEQGRVVNGATAIGPPAIYRTADLISWLDDVGLDSALVSVPPPLYRQGRGPQAARDWSRALNDALVSVLDGERLFPLAYLPLDEPEVAVDEVARFRREHPESSFGFSGSAGGGSVSLADPRLAPLWAALVEADLPMVLHPGFSPDARLDEFYLSNLLGNPAETGLAAGQLVFGRVLTDNPELRLALVHCGGVVPAIAGRWEQGVRSARPGVRPDVDVRGSLRRLWVDCLAHDHAMVNLAARTFGADHLLLGSDWPFPMGDLDPHQALTGLPDPSGPATANVAAFLGPAWTSRTVPQG